MVVLLSLASAMVCGMAIGPYSGKETGELALMQGNVDFVARLHHARKEDAYRIKRLGKKDHLIQWQRPQKPTWMDQETYDRMPESITLRQIEVNVTEPGFRVESLVIVTTLPPIRSTSDTGGGDGNRPRA